MNYNIPEEREDYTVTHPSAMDVEIDPALIAEAQLPTEVKSNLRLPPPPLFSRQGIPQIYKLGPFSDCQTQYTDRYLAIKPTRPL